MTAARDIEGPQNFDWLVDDFVGRVHGVTHALILSADGLPLAGSSTVSTDEGEQLAAISSGVLSLAHNGAAMFEKGTCEQIIIRLTEGYFLFMGIGTGAGLAVLTSSEAQMRVVAYEMTQFVENVGHALTPEVRADLRRVVTAQRPRD
ncbi:roadblock/LC7 domain-containing protein [Allosaccharopolyspora coralli]|uniref:Roadblock/LC7 domain-containing protein n=1 Tax=Allosaccharopolyspora coralli TaxID=2665642 RepID=A0A5Q3Q993_9PSEU|nr:roadblock/LC7 domain-containing protein [Allosaccharopolyspora coralli]QGK69774.1 roadblock/LC7 domain-containing protein [Allosaccharopolyspora coralli]